ncbi:hypothetical protein [Paraburkholderia rhynchosiae]|nr:hypothetical protein [Paraburkholderia rhynchosiae]
MECDLIDKLKQDSSLTQQFLRMYLDGWSGENIADAVAEYDSGQCSTARRSVAQAADDRKSCVTGIVRLGR